MSTHTPAKVMSEYLIVAGLATRVGQNLPWPLYINGMADMPNEALGIYDTQGESDGREMRGGRTVEHPGFQIRARVANNKIQQGIDKMYAIMAAMDDILRNNVTISGKTYRIQAVRRTSPILPLGPEEGGLRELYTTNGTITYGVL